jgi:hypothetical protein
MTNKPVSKDQIIGKIEQLESMKQYLMGLAFSRQQMLDQIEESITNLVARKNEIEPQIARLKRRLEVMTNAKLGK